MNSSQINLAKDKVGQGGTIGSKSACGSSSLSSNPGEGENLFCLKIVVCIDHFVVSHVDFVPLEYVPTIPAANTCPFHGRPPVH